MATNRELDAWTALADPTRHAIVARLADGPQAVGQLAAELPVTRSAVSQHLKVLKDAGLVSERAEGTRRIYRLNPHGVGALRTWLEGVWDQALTDFHKIAEQTAADNRFADPSADRRRTVATPNRSSHDRSRHPADPGQDHRERSR